MNAEMTNTRAETAPAAQKAKLACFLALWLVNLGFFFYHLVAHGLGNWLR